MHQIRGNGGPGKLLTRDRSCHQCNACWAGEWGECENEEMVGQVWPVELPKPVQVHLNLAIRVKLRCSWIGSHVVSIPE